MTAAQIRRPLPDGSGDLCEHAPDPFMERRMDRRRPVGLEAMLYRDGRPVARGRTRDVGLKGLFLSGQDVTTDGVIGALMGGLIASSAVLGRDVLADLRSPSV